MYLINCLVNTEHLVPTHAVAVLHPASGVAKISCEEEHETKRK